MTETFLAFLVFLFILGIIVQEDFIFTIMYLFAGAYLLSGWWSRKSMASVSFQRNFPHRAFIDEKVNIHLEIKNTSWLPVIWLRVQENLPPELALSRYFQHVISLGPHEKKQFDYPLLARKRGYYRVGPLSASSGDLFGLVGEQKSRGEADFITVYPLIVPLTKIKLPSNSPMGTLRHTQPMYEDPTRVLGKRDYVAGDSLRRVDWKASATLGRLQVKQFEPSIALETAIFLNLNSEEYSLRTRFDATELGIVVAASLANWIAGHQQTVGLYTNGLDPFSLLPESRPGEVSSPALMQQIPLRKGRGHLMRILDALARVEVGESVPYIELLRKEYPNLPWGTTLILISGNANEVLFDLLFQIRRSGLQAVLVMVGFHTDVRDAKLRAEAFHFPFYHIRNLQDLDIWRG